MSPNSQGLVPLPSWKAFYEKFRKRRGILFTLGEGDSGKSSFVTWIAHRFVEEKIKFAIVDADIGQSHIGPPGTLGLSFPVAPFRSLDELVPEELKFVGSPNPTGHFLPCLVGTKQLVEKATQLGASAILVNTTGFVKGDAAFAFKLAKLQLIAPQVIAAFQRAKELTPYLDWLKQQEISKVFLFSVSPLVNTRGFQERTEFRKKQWKKWLKQGRTITIPKPKIFPAGHSPRDWKNHMAALVSKSQRIISVGSVREADKFSLQLRTFPDPGNNISYLIIGDAEVDA